MRLSSLRHGPDSEHDAEEEGEEEPNQGGDTYIWLKLDAWYEAEGDDDDNKVYGTQHEYPGFVRGVQHQNTRLMRGDNACQLDVERGLHHLG